MAERKALMFMDETEKRGYVVVVKRLDGGGWEVEAGPKPIGDPGSNSYGDGGEDAAPDEAGGPQP